MYKFFKRFFDIIFSLLALIILSPVFIPICIVLKFTGEGESILYTKGLGINQKQFGIFKFATMLKNSENMGSGIYTAKNDNRILPFGHFLRKSKINELPQIYNILLGHISFVGPRPLIERTFQKLYSHQDRIKISSVKPGLTGIGSIVFRNEEEILLNAGEEIEKFYQDYITPYKANLEKWYVNNNSLSTDLIIIFLTAYVIIFKNSDLPWRVFKDLPKNEFIAKAHD